MDLNFDSKKALTISKGIVGVLGLQVQRQFRHNSKKKT